MRPKKQQNTVTDQLVEKSVLMARQAIFKADHSIFAFEVLYRGDRYDPSQDGIGATGELLNNLCTCVSDENLTSGKPLLINIDEHFIESPGFLPNQSDRIILEILETVPATESILQKVKELRKQGFEFALDDYIFEPERDAFLPLVSIVKVDVMGCSTETLVNGMAKLRQHKVALLAEKVEDLEMFTQCKELGFTLFQGYYLEKPKLVEGVKISANKQVTVRLLSELNRKDISVDDVAELIVCDPRLAMKLVLLVNSSLFSFVRKVSDVKEAVVILGIEAVKRWALILLMASESESPLELFRVLLARAKALELFAVQNKFQDESVYFSLGLYSGLDSVLGIHIKDLANHIPLGEELRLALTQSQGDMAKLLSQLKQIEQGSDVDDTDLSSGFFQLNATYWQGQAWADGLMDTIHTN